MLAPPIEPMLAQLSRELPVGNFLYEPKWDGFRCLAFVSEDGKVALTSRNQKPLGRYFPEVTSALSHFGPGQVLDGELVVAPEGKIDFGALLARVHPAASRIQLLSRQSPATLIVFDALMIHGRDLRPLPLASRRKHLDSLWNAPPPNPALQLTPCTEDPRIARQWFSLAKGSGLDGVIAKPLDSPYLPGQRVMIKVKLERTVECVVAGMRLQYGGELLGSLLLGLFDSEGRLQHVGVASSFTRKRRLELWRELLPLAIPLSEHPWSNGFGGFRSPIGRLRGAAGRWDPSEMSFDWVPLRPIRVCEVGFDQVDVTLFRHPARFKRWRPDRAPESCLLDQIVRPAAALFKVLAQGVG